MTCKTADVTLKHAVDHLNHHSENHCDNCHSLLLAHADHAIPFGDHHLFQIPCESCQHVQIFILQKDGTLLQPNNDSKSFAMN